MRDWMVAADDRTGALEVAAEIAAADNPVTVGVGRAPAGEGVVDLCTRALDGAAAAARAAAVAPASWQAHKIDSTLRGNWAAELRARQRASGRRVLLVPAWPAMGRTCRGGVVHVHGAPVAAVTRDLPEATLLDGPDRLARWLDGDGPFAACDVADTDELLAVAAAVRGREVLLAGPAGPIGAAFAAAFGAPVPALAPARVLPALVVCGSATDVSRVQLERLAAAHPRVEIVAAPPGDGPLHSGVVAAMTGTVRPRLGEFATVVLVGGDTAAAVLGEAPRLVGGTVAPGMPWSRDSLGGGPLVVTKAGGFGGPDALARLFGENG